MSDSKIGMYTRVSTEEQAREGFFLTVQREYLKDYAKREGHEWRLLENMFNEKADIRHSFLKINR